MTSRVGAWAGLCVALALAAPARADEVLAPSALAAKPGGPSQAPPPAPGATPARKPFSQRPVVVGLLAALFLIVAGAAAKNDKNTTPADP